MTTTIIVEVSCAPDWDVEIQELDVNENGVVSGNEPYRLREGEQHEFCIHDSRSLSITEVPKTKPLSKDDFVKRHVTFPPVMKFTGLTVDETAEIRKKLENQCYELYLDIINSKN